MSRDGTTAGLLQRLRPWLPWISLATGVGGALIMNRAPGRAWIVVVAAVLGWCVLVATWIVERAWARTPEDAETPRRKRARFALQLSTQIAIQQALLFPLPFYARAARVQPGHVAFFVLYAAVLVVVLWDPLFAWVMRRAVGALGLQAFAAFVGLNMVLPVFGMSNTTSLLVAGGATAIAVPALVLLELQPETWPRRLLAVPAAVLVVVAARFSAPLIPPAPLELVHVGIGTAVQGRELVGEARVLEVQSDLLRDLYCHSTVKAPLGLKDALVHVWRKDGKRVDEISVDVSGGREAGFRTWSRKRAAGPGRWSCSVETGSRQVLGRARLDVRRAPPVSPGPG